MSQIRVRNLKLECLTWKILGDIYKHCVVYTISFFIFKKSCLKIEVSSGTGCPIHKALSV